MQSKQPERGTLNTQTTEPNFLHRLHEDHARFMKVLAVFAHQFLPPDPLRTKDDDDRPNFSLVADILSYIDEFPDAAHHPAEEMLFELLLQQNIDASTRKSLETAHLEHGELKNRTRAVKTAIDNVLNGNVMSIDSLKVLVDQYIELQRSHILFEERNIFPGALARLSQQDWVTLESHLHDDPMFDLHREKYRDLATFIATAP